MHKFKKLFGVVIIILSLAVGACSFNGESGCGCQIPESLSKDARAFVDKVNALPEAGEITLLDENAVRAAEDAYYSVGRNDVESAKSSVIAAREKLNELESRIAALKEPAMAELSAEARAFVEAVDKLSVRSLQVMEIKQAAQTILAVETLYDAIDLTADKDAVVVKNALERIGTLKIRLSSWISGVFLDIVAQLPSLAVIRIEDEPKVLEVIALYTIMTSEDKNGAHIQIAWATLNALKERIEELKMQLRQEAVDDFLARVNAHPEPDAITTANELSILEAEKYYNALNPEDKERDEVKAALAKIKALKERIEELKIQLWLQPARLFIALVAGSPSIDDITIEDEPRILQVEGIYNMLIPEHKELDEVEAAWATLKALKDRIEELKSGGLD